MTKESKIIIGALALVLIGLGVLIWTSGGQPGGGSIVYDQKLILDNASQSQMTGQRGAKVALVEFGDYQCPACAYAEPIIKALMAEYQNNPQVNFVFRNFPLPQHGNAMASAEAAMAAGEQGKYWQMNQLLYEKQSQWSEQTDALTLFKGYAQQLGLDMTKFGAAMTSHKFLDIINQDKADGLKLGINSTPTFFVGTEKVVGALTQPQFKDLIEKQLK